MRTSGKMVVKICDISDVMECFRKYEIIQYFLINLPLVFNSMMSINFVFAVGNMNYRCRIEECEDANSTVQFPSWWPDTSIDGCFSPVLKSGEVCTNTSFTGELVECNRWIYENNNTVVAELNLACQPWKINLVGTIHCLGMLLSMIAGGWVSDKFGRKPMILFCMVTGNIGIIKTLATSYYVYIIIELLEAIVSGGLYVTATVLLMEIAGKRYRLLAGLTCSYTIYFGEFLLACIASLIPYWKTYIYIIYGPSILFIFFIFFINESPRWQIVTGRSEKAKQILMKIAKVNNINIDAEELEKIDEATLREKFDIKTDEIKENLVDAFKSKAIVVRLLVAGLLRFTITFVYYGLMINAVWLPGDKNMNFILTTFMSFPGELIAFFFMNKIGRKIPLLIGFSFCGIMCIISACIPAEFKYLKLAFFLFGKMIVSACFSGTINYSMELFPTSVRGSLIGMTSFCSRVGGMLAPLTPIMNTVSEALPFVIFGCCCIFSGFLLCLTPETKNQPLLDTISQVENYRSHKGKQLNE